MKQFTRLLIVALTLGLGFGACSSSSSDPKLPNKKGHLITFKLKLPDNQSDIKLTNSKLIAKELNSDSSETFEVEANEELSFTADLKSGLYHFSFEAKTKIDETETIYRGYLENSEINRETEKVISIYPFDEKANFVIEEIFYTGTVYPNTSKGYIGDQYFKITNNSDQPLYADGLVIAESTFTSTMKYDYVPDRKAEYVAVNALYAIPGKGDEYLIKPGSSMIIADKAINHKVEAHENSFDLSKADFEWYDESSSANLQDTDNPNVPNLDIIFSYTATIWVLNKQGNKSYMILRLDADKQTYLKDYKFDYSYIMPATGKEMNRSSLFVPNSWVIDAVNLSSLDRFQWNILDTSLDAGFTYCGENSKDQNRYGKSVRRKIDYIDGNGRKVLKDTNNSSEDFIHSATPSLLDPNS